MESEKLSTSAASLIHRLKSYGELNIPYLVDCHLTPDTEEIVVITRSANENCELLHMEMAEHPLYISSNIAEFDDSFMEFHYVNEGMMANEDGEGEDGWRSEGEDGWRSEGEEENHNEMENGEGEDEEKEKKTISVPEPPPIFKGSPIYDPLVYWMKNADVEEKDKNEMLSLLESRYNFGMHKYGQPLMTEDGRNSIKDCLEEIGDGMQYAFKALLNGEDVQKINRMARILVKLTDKE